MGNLKIELEFSGVTVDQFKTFIGISENFSANRKAIGKHLAEFLFLSGNGYDIKVRCDDNGEFYESLKTLYSNVIDQSVDITEKQKRILMSNGFTIEQIGNMSKNDAHAIVGEIIKKSKNVES